jgi:Adaptive response protein AidB N-terminal domain
VATPYDSEAVDHLPFGSPEKAARYATERYVGATGLNWWRCDPTLQFAMQQYLRADELAWATPHLDRVGGLMGGAVSMRAEQTDKHPPRLERYDRWGHDISEVVLPESFLASRREILDNGFTSPAIREDAQQHGVRLTMLNAAHSYMLDQAEIGMACALGTGGDMVVSLVRQFAPPDVRERVLAKFASGEWEGETIQSLTERTGGSDLA